MRSRGRTSVSHMYLLFDCNNFFASCEQVFRPDWRRRPLVVLSNNDGCVISRSAEAKALGIAMCEPYFKCRQRLEAAGGIVCSANFALYSDLSDRMIRILEDSLPEVQQYSIDEAFAVVQPGPDWEQEARRIRRNIFRWVGITVSVGIAPTRTLAKLANETAKKLPQYRGVMALNTPEQILSLLESTPVEEVWGVGRKLRERMRGAGIRTAAQLAAAPAGRLRRLFGVHGERLALELQGVSCLDEIEAPQRTQVMVSRTLSEAIDDPVVLRDALCRFVEKAGRILRNEGLMAAAVHVVLRTSRYEDTERLYAESTGCALSCHTDDTRVFTAAATALLDSIYRPGYRYRKVGVLLADLLPAEEVQPTFEHPDAAPSPLMEVLDKLQKSGHNIRFANTSTTPLAQKAHVSPAFTTSWNDLPEAR